VSGANGPRVPSRSPDLEESRETKAGPRSFTWQVSRQARIGFGSQASGNTSEEAVLRQPGPPELPRTRTVRHASRSSLRTRTIAINTLALQDKTVGRQTSISPIRLIGSIRPTHSLHQIRNANCGQTHHHQLDASSAKSARSAPCKPTPPGPKAHPSASIGVYRRLHIAVLCDLCGSPPEADKLRETSLTTLETKGTDDETQSKHIHKPRGGQ